jgi:hypothetical protein
MRNNHFTQKFATLLLLIIASGFSVCLNAQDGEGGWTKLASMSYERYLFNAGYLDGRIYAIGGVNAVDYLGNAEVYDTATNIWTPVANMHQSRVGLTAETWNSKIYAVGGIENEFATSTNVEVYDPGSDEWTVMGNSPVMRIGHTSCLYNNLVYVFGGYNEDITWATNTCYTYNPETDVWDTIASMISSRVYGGCCALGDKIYIFGGSDGFDPNNRHNRAEVYDPAADSFEEIANMPEITFYPLVFPDEETNKIVILGDYQHIFTYDPLTDTYTRMRDIPYLSEGTGAVKIDRYIYTMGGMSWPDYIFSKDLWRFNLDSLKEWVPVALTKVYNNSHSYIMEVYPNPFVESVIINYTLNTPSEVHLEVYNSLGKRMAVLNDTYQVSGIHQVMWNAAGVTPGIYLCKLKVNGCEQTVRLVKSY